MCHRRTNNSKIDRLHEIYKDKQYSFKEMLEKDSSFSYERNVQILATEM